MAEDKKEELGVAKELKDMLSDAFGIQKEMNEAAAKKLSLETDALKLKRQQVELEEAEKSLRDELADSEKELAELNAKKIEDARVYNQLLEEAAGNEAEIAKINKARLEEEDQLQKDIIKKTNEKKSLEDDIKIKANEVLVTQDKRAKKQEEILKTTKETSKEYQQQKAMADAINKSLGGLSKLPGGVGKFFQSVQKIYNGFQKIDKFMGKDGMGGKMKRLWDKSGASKHIGNKLTQLGKQKGMVGKAARGMSKGIAAAGPKLAKFGKLVARLRHPIAILVAVILAAVAALAVLGFKINDLSKSLSRATGYANTFHGEILDVTDNLILSGVGFKEATEALGDLQQGLSSYMPQNKKANKHMMGTVAVMKKFGIQGATSVHNMDKLQRAMGMTAEDSADLTANIAMMGTEVGITMKKASEDFKQSFDELSRYGNQAIEVFKKLSVQSKLTGIAMDSLTGMTDAYDTFDGAAEAATNLNAILGTQINHLDMLGKDKGEQILTLHRQIRASVGDGFNELGQYQKRAIADALKVNSVAEAAQIINMNETEYYDKLSKMKESGNVQQEMADKAAEFASTMDQLKNALMSMVLIFKPAIEGFAKLAAFMSKVAPVAAKVGKIIYKIYFALQSVVLVASFVGLAFGTVAAGITFLMNPLTWLVGALTALWWIWDDLKSLFSSVINPPFIRVFHFLAEGLELMAQPIKYVLKQLGRIAKFGGALFDKVAGFFGGNKEIENANIQAMATIDTSKLSSGFKQVQKSLSTISEIEMEGVIMARPDGTVIAGGQNLLETIHDGRLQIEVNVPEPKQPTVNTIVKIGETELKKLIELVTAETVVGAA